MVPREGSSLYYSLLWTEATARERFLDRLALLRTLARTLDEVQDPGVAERKVHWWHEELERLARGEPRHPRTVACRDSLAGLEAAAGACLEVLSLAASERYTPAATDTELHDRLRRAWRARLALLAHALDDSPATLDDEAVRHPALALGLGLHARLSRLPALLHRGFAVFSEERYERHGSSPARLARQVRRAPEASAAPATRAPGGIPIVVEPPTPGHAAAGARPEIVAAVVDEACEALGTALADGHYRESYARPALAPLARLAALRARQLRLWQEAGPDLLTETMTPTPLVKLYIAWRHRRGAR